MKTKFEIRELAPDRWALIRDGVCEIDDMTLDFARGVLSLVEDVEDVATTDVSNAAEDLRDEIADAVESVAEAVAALRHLRHTTSGTPMAPCFRKAIEEVVAGEINTLRDLAREHIRARDGKI